LFELSEALTRTHLAALVGSRQEVLVEGPGRGPGTWEGRTIRNEIVHLSLAADELGNGRATETETELSGAVVEVDVVEAFKHSLRGRPTAQALAKLPPPGSAAPRPPTRRRPLPIVA